MSSSQKVPEMVYSSKVPESASSSFETILAYRTFPRQTERSCRIPSIRSRHDTLRSEHHKQSRPPSAGCDIQPLRSQQSLRYSIIHKPYSKFSIIILKFFPIFSGTTYSGHYTAYCKHPYNGEWHEYNDSR